MYDDCGKTGCPGPGSFILILGPLWAIGILVVIVLSLLASAWITNKLCGPRSSWTTPSLVNRTFTLILFAGLAYIFVKAWFKIGYYGAGLLGKWGL